MLVAHTGGRYTQQDWYAEARKEETKEQEMRRRGERTTIISGGRERKRDRFVCLEADDTQG
jgi:uncharacterized radical SAM superfamily protein